MIKESQTTNTNEFDRDVQMLKYFQDEFLYRHKHFWNILVKSFLLTATITIIPIIKELSGIEFDNEVIAKYYIVFPLLGLALAIGSFLLLLDESRKLSAVNNVKYQINQRMDEKYRYIFYNNASKKAVQSTDCDKSLKRVKMPSLTYSIVTLFFILELAIVSIVLVMVIC